MIASRCPHCGSPNLVKHGRTASGQQNYHCKNCRRYGTLDTRVAARHRQRQLVEQVQTERVSQRGIARSIGISRTTMIKWLKKSH